VNRKPKPITGTEDLSPQKKTTTKKGTRLPEEWVLPKSWGEFALSEKPNWTADDVRRVAADFKDHWLSNANQSSAKKADWLATWRKWVRSPLNDIKTKKINGSGEAPWWSSNESMIAKGGELGLSPRAGESWGDFKGRIQTKMSNHQGA
jgi:hypothetical protein